MVSNISSLTHATGLFLREGFEIVYRSNVYRMQVKPELPIDVQFRVSALRLFHEVLAFLEAESSSSM